MTDIKVGAQVRVDGATYPGVWDIIKVNPKTVMLKQGDVRLKCDKGYLLPPDGAVTAVSPNNVGRSLPMQTPGAVVRYVGRGASAIANGDLVVVIADKGEKVNIAPLGGFDGTTAYLRAHHRNLLQVDNTKVSITLA